MEGETRDGEIEIEGGAKDLNFGGISRSSREAVDDLPDQLAEPFMFCLVLLLSIVRRDIVHSKKRRSSHTAKRNRNFSFVL